jgi:hypothetical protein
LPRSTRARSFASLALELAPIRVKVIAAGFVDAPLPATLLGAGSINARASCARRCRSGA